MKNTRAIGLLLIAVVIGLAAAFYASAWLSSRANISANKVVVAAVDIPAGSKLNAQMLSAVDWPSGSLPAGAVQDTTALHDRVVKLGLLRGEAILEGKLAPVGTMGGLSAVIAEGKRAMTVRVNDVVGVAGFALPGTYVDVLVNARKEIPGKGEATSISKTVLENVLVLAAAQEASRDDTKPKVVNAVTLELSLEDAEKLDLARSVGTLSLVLRNQVDSKKVATSGITKQQLFVEAPLVEVAAPLKPAPKARNQVVKSNPGECVEVIRMQDGSRANNCFN